MATYADALSRHPEAIAAVGEVAGSVLEQLGTDPPDLVLVFASAHHVASFDDITEALRRLLEPDVLLGCTASGVVGGAEEVEGGPGLSVFAATFDEGALLPVRLEVVPTPDGPQLLGWPDALTLPAAGISALLVLADPFSFPADGFLARLAAEHDGVPVIGGLASAGDRPGGNRLALGGETYDSGAVAVIVDRNIAVRSVVSQGCRPLGNPYVVTKAERNVIAELGGMPAFSRLQMTAAAASEDERSLMRGGLHIGRVINEHRLQFRSGDFLVRSVVGADQGTGALAVNDLVEVGQTVQFHVRDALSADEDLRSLLSGAAADAALLFTCNGRGTNMFATRSHDASAVSSLLGPLPLAGAFCAGELGPVGTANFLHGFTASLALFGHGHPSADAARDRIV